MITLCAIKCENPRGVVVQIARLGGFYGQMW